MRFPTAGNGACFEARQKYCVLWRAANGQGENPILQGEPGISSIPGSLLLFRKKPA
jgi:hypothetical protein